MDLTARRTRLAALPALAVLVVAIAFGAAATSGASTASQVDQPAAIDTLTVVLTLLAVVLVGLLTFAVWIWLRSAEWRRGRGSGNGVHFSFWHHLLVTSIPTVLFIVLAFLILHLSRREQGGGAGGAGFVGAPRAHARDAHTLPYSITAAALTLGAIALLVGAAFAYAWWRRRQRRRDAARLLEFTPEEGPGPEYGASTLLDPLAGVTIADPRTEPDPRKAVIAAWIAMADAIGRIWRPRSASEAPREYLRDALVAAGVGAGSAGWLTSLFEVARWSDQQVGEQMRTDAIAALDTVRAELRAAS